VSFSNKLQKVVKHILQLSYNSVLYVK